MQSTSAAMKSVQCLHSRVLAITFLVFCLMGADALAQQVTETPENLSRVAYNEGLELVRAEQFDQALSKFNEGIELDESNPRNYYMKGLVQRRLGNDLESIQTYLQAAEVAAEAGDSRLEEMARANAARGYVVMAARSLQNDRNREALEHLNQSLEYGEPDADAHFYFSRAFNALGQYEQAIEHAQQGIEKETGGRQARAKIYFELGMAYKNIGDTQNARAAFEEAAVGQYRRPAEYELEYMN